MKTLRMKIVDDVLVPLDPSLADRIAYPACLFAMASNIAPTDRMKLGVKLTKTKVIIIITFKNKNQRLEFFLFNNGLLAVDDVADCPGNGFKCHDGTCVPEHAFCNSIVDCSDGSDEPEQACKREYRRKKTDEYCPVKCRNGRCRSAAVLCTGTDGCGDNSDESQCSICRKLTMISL